MDAPCFLVGVTFTLGFLAGGFVTEVLERTTRGRSNSRLLRGRVDDRSVGDHAGLISRHRTVTQRACGEGAEIDQPFAMSRDRLSISTPTPPPIVAAIHSAAVG